jgi:cysteine synthase B
MVVEDDEAFETTRLLATKEGLFLGISSGAAVAGALRMAKNMDRGTIVVILPDRGDRYLSTTLFRSFCAKCPP